MNMFMRRCSTAVKQQMIYGSMVSNFNREKRRKNFLAFTWPPSIHETSINNFG